MEKPVSDMVMRRVRSLLNVSHQKAANNSSDFPRCWHGAAPAVLFPHAMNVKGKDLAARARREHKGFFSVSALFAYFCGLFRVSRSIRDSSDCHARRS
jgi:hypothetical protein